MTASTGEIVLISALVILVGVCLWWLIIGYKYNQSITSFSFTRGANIDTGKVGTGTTGKGTVNMDCGPDREICVWKATGICSGAISSEANVESLVTEPISGDVKTYGDFNPSTTLDLTQDMITKANGKQSYSYNFDGTKVMTPGGICPFQSYNQKQNYGQRPQLIATYTCIPTGTVCNSKKVTLPKNIRY